ncbi:MAG: hypothetical protein NTU98_06260 [Bacteroidetes bacterium]|nr:hypothetical protein [Bacteroidota bacterium]
MNCRDAIEILDRMIFEEVPADAGLRQHIDTCPSCSQAYRDALKAREVMDLVRRSEPVLRDPDEITDNIMSAIQQGLPKTVVVPMFLQRLLAAASVALFLLFGYEQYGVVSKVTALETTFSATRADSRFSDPQRLASAFDINRAGISFTEIGRLISTVKGTNPLSFSSIKKQMNQRKTE